MSGKKPLDGIVWLREGEIEIEIDRIEKKLSALDNITILIISHEQ